MEKWNRIKNNVELLQENTKFQATGEQVISYDFTAPEYAELIGKYHFEELLSLSDAEKAISLLKWINTHVRHRGNYDNSDVQDALTLLNICCECCGQEAEEISTANAAPDVDKVISSGRGVNCLAMSIILCECLLAVGVKTRVVYMMPQAVEDGDNHVVVEAFVTEWNKWVMLDATYGSYCVSEAGIALHLGEIRDCICNGEEYSFSEGMNYNGDTNLDLVDIKEYYAKNLFFLRCKSKQGYGEHRSYSNMLEIAPVGFNVRERMVKNLNYRIREYGEHEIFRRWLEYEVHAEPTYIDMEKFYS